MVEIIERGLKPEERSYEARCCRCNSLLRFKHIETQPTAVPPCRKIKCPVCETLILVEE